MDCLSYHNVQRSIISAVPRCVRDDLFRTEFNWFIISNLICVGYISYRAGYFFNFINFKQRSLKNTISIQNTCHISNLV